MLVVKNSFIEFKIEHCSDYILTDSIIEAASNNPLNTTIIIVALIIGSVLLVSGTLSVNEKK